MMVSPEISEFARAMAVMVEVKGPDPKAKKRFNHPFFHVDSGIITVSCSGILLPTGLSEACGISCDSPSQTPPSLSEHPTPTTSFPTASEVPAVVITCASAIQSFLKKADVSKDGLVGRSHVVQSSDLLPGASVQVLLEVQPPEAPGVPRSASETSGASTAQLSYLPVESIELVENVEAARVLQPLLEEGRSGRGGGWEVGWKVAQRGVSGEASEAPGSEAGVKTLGQAPGPMGTVPEGLGRKQTFVGQQQPGGFMLQHALSLTLPDDSWAAAATAVRLAVLRLGVGLQGSETGPGTAVAAALRRQEALQQNLRLPRGLGRAAALKRGDTLVAVGSPFGALSPHHFHNSVLVGGLANKWRPSNNEAAILMLDMRCLPGAEGGPVISPAGGLVGMTMRPIYRRNNNSEVQLALAAESIVLALTRESVGGAVHQLPCSIWNRTERHEQQQQRQSDAPPLSVPVPVPGPGPVPVPVAVRAVADWGGVSGDKQWGAPSPSRAEKLGAAARDAQVCHWQGPHPPAEHASLVAEAVAAAGPAVVLVSVGQNAWASGVVISESGLVLTNAHLLEPWRFGPNPSPNFLAASACAAGPPPSPRDRTRNDPPHLDAVCSSHAHASSITSRPSPTDGSPECSPWSPLPQSDWSCLARSPASVEDRKESHGRASSSSSSPCAVLSSQGACWGRGTCSAHVRGAAAASLKRSSKRILVRLQVGEERQEWREAEAVYVSQGPVDVALLQLIGPPPGLVAIKLQMDIPTPGALAVVLGHGLFGPSAELQPSASIGVVARVVLAPAEGPEAPPPGSGRELKQRLQQPPPQLPAMIETTAAVHAGGSGGAVVDRYGHMIGLVTSNARHNSSGVLPHLNFSLPVCILRPIFQHAASGTADPRTLQHLLDLPNESFAAVWALVPNTSPLTPPLQQGPPSTSSSELMSAMKKLRVPGGAASERGSRFAKFVTETKDGFGKAASSLGNHDGHGGQDVRVNRDNHHGSGRALAPPNSKL